MLCPAAAHLSAADPRSPKPIQAPVHPLQDARIVDQSSGSTLLDPTLLDPQTHRSDVPLPL